MTPSIAARLNRLPITRLHRTVVIIAGIGTFFDLFDIFLAGVLATVLTDRFQLSRVSLPAVIGSGFLGMFLGALGLGRLADRVGRRPAFLFNLGIYSVFTLLGGLSPNAAVLIVTRFLAGIGIGAELPLVDAYLSELLPPRNRGRFTSIAYTIGFLGIPAVGVLARILVPVSRARADGWRWLFVAGSVGGGIVWFLRHAFQSRPMAGVGRAASGGRGHHRATRSRRSAWALEEPNTSERPAPGPASFTILFSKEYLGRTAVLWVFPGISDRRLLRVRDTRAAGAGVERVSGHHIADHTSVVFVGYPLGSALSLLVVERIDRRWLIVGSAFL